jgi:hypothetical protein
MSQKQASVPMLVVASLVLVLVLVGLWWKFVGPGSAPAAPVFKMPTPPPGQGITPAEPPVASSGSAGR